MNGPFLLEVQRRDGQADNPRWVLQQSVPTLNEGLRIASRMTQYSPIRLFLGAAYGYAHLDWAEPDENDECAPYWKMPETASLF